MANLRPKNDQRTEISEYIRKTATTFRCLVKTGKGGEQEQEPSWKDRRLKDVYHHQTEEVADIKKSDQWLEKAGLKNSAEPLIIAAQERAVSTRLIEAGVSQFRQDPRC